MTSRLTRRSLLANGGTALGGTLLLSLAGCGGSAGETAGQTSLRVAWWGADERHKKTIEALKLYSSKHAGVTATTEYTGDFSGFFDKLATQVAGGGAPDLIQMSGQFIAEYGQRNALLDLGKYVPKPIDLSSWQEDVRKQGDINGKLVGIPPALDGYAVVYDKTKLDELGVDLPPETWTWQDFATLCQEISKAGGGDYRGSEDAGYQYEPLQVFLRQRGKDLLPGDGELGYDKADITEFWQFWGDLRKAGGIVSPDVQSAGGADPEGSPIVKKLAALEFSSSSQLVNFAGLTTNTVGLTTYPFAEDGTGGQVVRAGMYFSGTSKTRHPDAVADVINFLVNDKEAAAVLGTSRGVPASPAMRESIKATVSDVERQSFDYLDVATKHSGENSEPLKPFPPGFGDHRTLYERLYFEVAFGRMTLQEGVDDLLKQAPGLVK